MIGWGPLTLSMEKEQHNSSGYYCNMVSDAFLVVQLLFVLHISIKNITFTFFSVRPIFVVKADGRLQSQPGAHRHHKVLMNAVGLYESTPRLDRKAWARLHETQ